jgi:hypothetical protein
MRINLIIVRVLSEFIKGELMDPGYEMLFETTIRTFLEDKAYHIAGQVHNQKHRKEWYRKVLKKIIFKIQEIDTSTKHK